MTLLDTPSLDAAADVADAAPAPQGLIVIERTHPSQTPAGLAMLSHLANSPAGCLFAELYTLFSHVQGSLGSFHTTPGNLRGRLAHLELKGYVTSHGRGDTRVYRLGDLSAMPTRPKAGTKAAPTVRRAPAGSKAADCGMPTPPRQYDVMFGPVYQPGPSPALRAGSQDFRQLRSHGYGC
jgi:hypothetical protein